MYINNMIRITIEEIEKDLFLNAAKKKTKKIILKRGKRIVTLQNCHKSRFQIRMARETLVRATLPNFHLPAAAEILTTGINFSTFKSYLHWCILFMGGGVEKYEF